MSSPQKRVEEELRIAQREAERLSFRYFDADGKFIPKLLAVDIMGKYAFLTMRDNEQLYVYLDGYYQPFGEVLVKEECNMRLDEEYRKQRTLEVIDYIKTSTYTDRREEAPNLVPLENGVLDLDTMELKPLSPEYMFFNKLPVKYNGAAICPQIDQFHKEITNGEEDIALLEEWIGFCLYREYFIAKSMMLVGEGANGKSTWLNLLKALLGPRNVSSRGLQDLEENRFAKADLYTKLANLYADLPDKALYRTGTFKMLTGRDFITAEKKFQNSFNYVNYAKLGYSANKVPEAYDDTVAFFRRWVIVTFPNIFEGDKADPYILEKLTTEEELSGLLNRVLQRLKKLRETGQFSQSKTTDEIREDYIRKSSPIASFVMDCLEVDSESYIVKKELYSSFGEYCRRFKLPCVGQDTFFKNLPKHIAVAEYRPKIGSERPSSFKGIRFVSTLSTVSTLSPILIKQKEKPSPTLIKMGKTLDRVDTLDTEGLPTPPKPSMGLQEALRDLVNKTEELTTEAGGPISPDWINEHLKWNQDFFDRILNLAIRDRVLYRTPEGLIGVSW